MPNINLKGLRKRSRVLVLVWLVFLLSLVACLPQETLEARPEKPLEALELEFPATWHSYRATPFKLSLPETWQVLSMTSALSAFSASLPKGVLLLASLPQDKSNLSGIVFLNEDVPLLSSLDKYSELSLHNLQSSIESLSQLRYRFVELPIGKVTEIRYTALRYDAEGIGHELHHWQYLLLRKGKGYVLQCAMAEDLFAKDILEFDNLNTQGLDNESLCLHIAASLSYEP
ncbi:MAG: hypothetical protein R2880_18145 [Deinococcales bacterium]